MVLRGLLFADLDGPIAIGCIWPWSRRHRAYGAEDHQFRIGVFFLKFTANGPRSRSSESNIIIPGPHLVCSWVLDWGYGPWGLICVDPRGAAVLSLLLLGLAGHACAPPPQGPLPSCIISRRLWHNQYAIANRAITNRALAIPSCPSGQAYRAESFCAKG